MNGRITTWQVVLVVILLALSVLSLAVSGADRPYRIQTFGRSSAEEHAFDRRATWLRAVGYASLGGAALVGALNFLW